MSDLATHKAIDAAQNRSRAAIDKVRLEVGDISGASKAAEDVINEPQHYQVAGVEVRDIQKDVCGELVGMDAIDVGNAIKYVLRSTKKDNFKQDLQKAVRYLSWAAERSD